MSENYLEKRREVRIPAKGWLQFMWEGGPPSAVDGDLLDISPHGFRALHSHTELATGQEVGFRHSKGEGRARVMWTRILNSKAESGFFILSGAD